jgi:hypothetical protein
MNKEELKAKLLAQAEAAIESVLANKGLDQKMTLREIVALAHESGQRMEGAVLEGLTQEQAEAPGEAVVCEQCGRRMHPKGKRVRDAVTSAGETRIERGYYSCAHCKAGRFPPG